MMQTSEAALDKSHSCPLCHFKAGRRMGTVSFRDIWKALEQDLGARFSSAVIVRHTPSENTGLYECSDCGLHYFSPAVAGDSEFYRELATTAAAYYSQDKWDFSMAAGLIPAGSHVLDVACGSGRFLEILRDKGAVGTGIDTNSAAAKEGRNKGLTVYDEQLADFAESNGARFDFVTAFQVIEHVPDAQAFVISAVRCLKPGGKLVLTVPNRQRCTKYGLEPLDCPPHHVSRWSDRQFQTLACLARCQLVGTYLEIARMEDCRTSLRRRIAKRHPQSLWARAVGRVVFGPVLYGAYARLGLLERWKRWGLSAMCLLEKPAGPMPGP